MKKKEKKEKKEKNEKKKKKPSEIILWNLCDGLESNQIIEK
jgi:hypothetical protein